MTNELLKIIQSRVCYTPLVYERVNKKLSQIMLPTQVDELVTRVLNSEYASIISRGKNYYIEERTEGVILTINKNNYRLITINKSQGVSK
ncbi:DUF3781 domain-containing protein [Leuconostoc gelidum subsp. gelidum]|uniref:DUF3781 domain-containing protein n=1 Tax=Leuconostoc gelidum TaxID=1244 RepID=UPI001CC4407C|nr:DUF3781 domain-containing protein [Leuconostoc gelidum]MBZ5977835.1 DUF3781 domain-containing protein [Leuconostoc gelidum subsp. gelidum]MBZ6001844.1 DUF3781 domain-containing protein [Leuconostoc gelidum subsp. gelidum]